MKALAAGKEVHELVKNEAYWQQVRALFQPQTDFINLENGYFSAQPQSTLAQQLMEVNRVNTENSFFMRRSQNEALMQAKSALAQFAGLHKEEFVICRNTTEALDTVVHGYPWQAGDEVIVNKQDYYSMLAAFEQQKRRSGIKLKYAKIPQLPKTDEEVVKAFEKEITSKTKMILVTHLINLTGQVLPLNKLVEMAHGYGVEVMVDAAHSFAHVLFNIKETKADYLGTSLHKWLCCPMGLGLLYIDPKNIEKVWPLFGDDEYAANDIRKFEHWGTRPVSAMATIAKAVDFHEAIGSELKFERLFYLKNYWTSKAAEIKKVQINTPMEKSRSGAIANFSIEGLQPDKIAQRLYDEHNIFTVAINSEEVKGVRVTPHLYNNTAELDKLLEAIEHLAA